MKKAVSLYSSKFISLTLALVFLFYLVLPLQGCKRKKPDEILLVKNLITRWENGVILNNPDSLQSVFSQKKDLVVKMPDEMVGFVFNSGIQNIRVAGRSIRLYREEGKVQSAQADLTLSGNKVAGDSLQAWQGKLHLLLRKHRGQWGIVDYKFE